MSELSAADQKKVQESRQHLSEIEQRWASKNPVFKNINDTPMEMQPLSGFVLVTGQNTIEAVFTNYDKAVEYTQMPEDVRFLLELLRTRYPFTNGENTSLQAPTE